MTPNQLDMARIIQEFHDVYGRSPSIRELAKEMDRSPTSTQVMISRMRDDGLIKAAPAGKKYSLQLTRRVPYAPDVARELDVLEGGAA